MAKKIRGYRIWLDRISTSYGTQPKMTEQDKVKRCTEYVENSILQIATDLVSDRLTYLVDGFVLTCSVEGKSPNTVVFYKGILDR